MKLRLLRRWFTDISTIGELYVYSKFFCYTLEDTTRANGIKIDGETAIPFGTYEWEINYSPKFKQMMPQVLRVPRFEGIRFHAGLRPIHTRGCILVGYSKGKDEISRSKEAYQGLFKVMTAAGGKGTLEITPTITIM